MGFDWQLIILDLNIIKFGLSEKHTKNLPHVHLLSKRPKHEEFFVFSQKVQTLVQSIFFLCFFGRIENIKKPFEIN